MDEIAQSPATVVAQSPAVGDVAQTPVVGEVVPTPAAGQAESTPAPGHHFALDAPPILAHIFSYVRSRPNDHRTQLPNFDLRLCLVCRSWTAEATRALYHSITVCNNKQIIALNSSVTSKPDIARCVKRLELREQNPSQRIIRTSRPKQQHQSSLYGAPAIKAIEGVVRQCTQLREFVIITPVLHRLYHNTGFHDCASHITSLTLYPIHHSWKKGSDFAVCLSQVARSHPHLQRISIIEEDCRDFLASHEPRSIISSLKTVYLKIDIQPLKVRYLLALAPFVEEVYLHIKSGLQTEHLAPGPSWSDHILITQTGLLQSFPQLTLFACIGTINFVMLELLRQCESLPKLETLIFVHGMKTKTSSAKITKFTASLNVITKHKCPNLKTIYLDTEDLEPDSFDNLKEQWASRENIDVKSTKELEWNSAFWRSINPEV